mgnify:CR=1 FL=1
MNAPNPTPNADSAPYWEAAAAGQLRLQQCQHCGAMQSIPRAHCARCHRATLGWIQASGRGRVASFTWVERGPSAAFREPYMLALIDLDEGVRLMMNILDAQPDAIAIGDPVRIVFEARQPDGPILPQARALRPSSAQPETP